MSHDWTGLREYHQRTWSAWPGTANSTNLSTMAANSFRCHVLNYATREEWPIIQAWLRSMPLRFQLLVRMRYWITTQGWPDLPTHYESDQDYEHLVRLANGEPIFRSQYWWVEEDDFEDLRTRFSHLVDPKLSIEGDHGEGGAEVRPTTPLSISSDFHHMQFLLLLLLLIFVMYMLSLIIKR